MSWRRKLLELKTARSKVKVRDEAVGRLPAVTEAPHRPTFVLNFGHPLADSAQAVLEDYLEGPVRAVRVPFDLDLDRPTAPQVKGRVDAMASALRGHGVRLDGTSPVVVALPGITEGAALLLAELHGRLGAFPRAVRLRRQADGTWLPDKADPLMDLERLRNEARGRR